MDKEKYRTMRRELFRKADELTERKMADYEADDSRPFFKVAGAMEGRRPAEVAYSGLVQSAMRLGKAVRDRAALGDMPEDLVNWVALTLAEMIDDPDSMEQEFLALLAKKGGPTG